MRILMKVNDITVFISYRSYDLYHMMKIAFDPKWKAFIYYIIHDLWT